MNIKIYLETLFSLEQNNFFLEHKLLPVHLTWLHLVYGKILFYARQKKDQDHLTKKSGIIYRYKCDRLECDEEYIGETARTFGERYKEHLKAPSPIYDHYNISGHNITLNNFSIVGREEQNLSRLIKESMFIRVNNPSLNKNIGKYHLPHIWDEVLINNIELKLK